MSDFTVDEWGLRRAKRRKQPGPPAGHVRPPSQVDIDPWGLRSAPKGEGGPRAALTWGATWAVVFAPPVALLAYSEGAPFLGALGYALAATPVFALLGAGGQRKREGLYRAISFLASLPSIFPRAVPEEEFVPWFDLLFDEDYVSHPSRPTPSWPTR